MTSRVLVLLLTTTLCFVCCNPVRGQGPVEFSDASLKAAIEDTLWITDPTPADMLGLRELKCIGQ